MTARQLITGFLVLFVVGIGACRADDPIVVNHTPSLQIDSPSQIRHVIGEGIIRITATATDEDGGLIEVSLVDAPPRAEFQTYDNIGVFTWDPVASDATRDEPLVITFVAEDQQGAQSQRTVTIEISPGNGVPQFLNTPSVLHNIDSGSSVTFEVRVRDDDDDDVDIQMPEATSPEGATFTRTSAMRGRFTWEPDEQQLQYRVHSVVFVADDGRNDPVEQKVAIYFKKDSGGQSIDPGDDGEGCDFESVVRHVPLGPQRGTDDYIVEAELTADASRRYDRLILNWSNEDVFNNLDVQMEGTEMKLEAGSYRAKIPNPLLPANESMVMYLRMCAVDDDSTDDESVICGPTNVFDSFIAYSPQQDTASCIDDEVENRDFESAEVLADYAWYHHRLCQDAPDYYAFTLEPEQSGDVFFTYPRGQGVGVKMFDPNKQSVQITQSSCSGFAYAFITNETNNELTYYFEVTGHDVPYQVSPLLYDLPSEACDDSDEPNDTADAATPIDADGTPHAGAICDKDDLDVYSFSAFPGDVIEAKARFAQEEGDLDIKLYAPSSAANIEGGGVADEYGLSVTDDEELRHTAMETGTYHLVVFGYSDANDYELEVVVDTPIACNDMDQFDDNHTQTKAQPIGESDYTQLQVCPEQDDWYSFGGNSSRTYFFDVEVTKGDLDDIDLELYDGTTLLQTATRNGSRKGIVFFPTESKNYDLRVTSASPTTYDLLIFVTQF